MKKVLGVVAAGLLLGCIVAGAEADAQSKNEISNESVLIADGKTSKKDKSKKKKKCKKSCTKKKVKKISKGQKIFGSHCASCHAGGGNIVRPSRSIKGSATLATFATFKAYLDKPVGDMPHYEHLITNEKMLRDLYKYTKTFDKEGQTSDEIAPKAKKTEKKSKSKKKK